MEAILSFAFSVVFVICFFYGLNVISDQRTKYHEDHHGPVQRAKGVLLKKEISSYFPVTGRFYCLRPSDTQKILFLSTFQIDGEEVLFYSDSVIYDKLKEGKVYRLQYQGNRITAVKRGKL